MAEYQVAIGWDNSASLAALSWQPSTDSIVSGRRERGGDGILYQDGYSVVQLKYGYIEASVYDTLLDEFGLASAQTAKVTMRLRVNDDRSFANFNCFVDKPEGYAIDDDHWRDVEYNILIVGSAS